MTETNRQGLMREILPLVIGSLVVAGAIVGVFALIGKFHWTVITGSLLGAAAALANQLFLIISTNRIFDTAVKERGSEEMTEEQIAEFTEKHRKKMANAVRISMIVRLPVLALVLLAAFLMPFAFSGIATGIAIIAVHLLIMFLGAFINRKTKPKTTSSK